MPSAAQRLRPSRWLRVGLPALVILIWLVGGGVGGPYFGKVSEVSTNDRSAYLPSDEDSTVVAGLLPSFLGDDLIPAVVVVAAVDGTLTEEQLTALADLPDRIAEVQDVNGAVSPPIPSEDGVAVQLFVPIATAGDVDDAVGAVRSALADAIPSGTEAWVTGPAGFTADLVEGFRGIDGLLLLVTLIAVFVILVIVYRSPLLPVLVLLTSTFALCVALLVVWWLAKAGVFLLNGQVQGILFILVIGAATDYALLYTARYREALASGHDRWRAAVTAWRGAVEPILASGGTVIAGLLCLLLSSLGTNRALGPIASIGIGFAMLSALTFLPALLAVFGRAAFWPFPPKSVTAADVADPVARAGLWPRTARFVAKHPRPIWIVATLVLVAGAGGMLQLKADGVPSSEFVLGQSEARDGQQALAAHFPGGSGSPAYALVPQDRLGDAVGFAETVNGIDGITIVSADSPTGQAGVQRASDGTVTLLAQGPPGTAAPTATVVDGDVLLSLTLADPADSRAAEQTVTTLRAGFDRELGQGAVRVGGETAVDVDTIATSIRDRTLIIPIVLVVILLILMLLLRSILAPVLLVITTVISFGTALGISALVFNHVFDFPGADPSVPLYGFVFLVALGIDYNIFLMTRVREESLAHGTRQGVLRGLVTTGGVITSAGLVLAATFAALGVIPILFLAQIAFIVAIGVLIDTFIVRSLLVPALVTDIGRAVWWPSKLGRGAH